MNDKQSIEAFSRAFDELSNTTYLLAEKKIAAVLKAIAVSDVLMELFAFCTKDFDYDKEKKNFFVKGDNIDGKYLLPPDSRTIIALSFTLLYKIDVKEEEFFRVLSDYFCQGDLNLAFKRFSAEFLKPFKVEVLSAVGAMITGVTDEPRVVAKRPAEKPAISFSDAALIKDLLKKSKGVILQYKIEPELKADLMALYDNFDQALFESDPDRIKVAFLGYKYSTLYHRKLDVSVNKIEDILKACGVL